jgi:uncharacterized membrane protein
MRRKINYKRASTVAYLTLTIWILFIVALTIYYFYKSGEHITVSSNLIAEIFVLLICSVFIGYLCGYYIGIVASKPQN